MTWRPRAATLRKALVALAPVAPLVPWNALEVTGKSPE
jgi:hypothetical protein